MPDIFLTGQTLPADALNQWIQAGTAEASFSNSLTAYTTVTFDHGFATVPVVTAVVGYGSPSAGSGAVFGVRLGHITEFGFGVRLHRVESSTPLNTTVTVQWQAVGRPYLPLT